jgi:hypothetical protein
MYGVTPIDRPGSGGLTKSGPFWRRPLDLKIKNPRLAHAALLASAEVSREVATS